MQKALHIFKRLQTVAFILVIITSIPYGVSQYSSYQTTSVIIMGNITSGILIFGLLLSLVMLLIGIVDFVHSTRQKNLQSTSVAKQMLLNGIIWFLLYLSFFYILSFILSSFMVPIGGTLPDLE